MTTAARDTAATPDDRWDAKLYDNAHAFVWQRGRGVLDLLQPKPGERILDLGCGTGHLTAEIAAAGAEVLGFDASAAMVEEARAKHAGVRFEVADATSFDFGEGAWDAIFSNAALHWVKPPEKAVARMAASLKRGGRVVAEFGGKGNVAAVLAAAQAAAEDVGAGVVAQPNYFPGVGEYATLLERLGLEVRFAELFDRPTPLEGAEGLRNWVRMFRPEAVGSPLDDATRERFFVALEHHGRAAGLCRDGGWFADYRRLRVVAVKA